MLVRDFPYELGLLVWTMQQAHTRFAQIANALSKHCGRRKFRIWNQGARFLTRLIDPRPGVPPGALRMSFAST